MKGGQEIEGWGADGSGILAQSIGGGGGNGGVNVSGIVFTQLGGPGRRGWIWWRRRQFSDVTVTSDADINVTGVASAPSAAGILAQSIGGGGGNGGLDVSGGLSISKGNVPSLALGIGGNGGTGATAMCL